MYPLVSKEESTRARSPNYSMRISRPAPNRETFDISFEMLQQNVSPWDKAIHLPGALCLAIPASRTGVIYATVILS